MENKIEEKTLQQWIDNETRKREVIFWGQRHEIQPVLCPEKIGDGLQLVHVTPIDSRPDYWLILIDSKTDVEADDFNIEDLLLPLEENFGRAPDIVVDEPEFIKYRNEDTFSELHNYDDFEDYNESLQYPHIYWGGGSWGTIVNFGK